MDRPQEPPALHGPVGRCSDTLRTSSIDDFPPGSADVCRRPQTRSVTLLARTIAGAVAVSAGSALLPARAMPEGTTVSYRSPHGIEERCIILDRMPGGVYSDADKAEEKAFCDIDFHDGSHALCPKVFSTSPGTLVYDISRGRFAGRMAAFESGQCATSSPIKRGAVGEPVAYKTTMNSAQTSATFSTASLLYYHFSRYLDAAVHVPVSVYRSMDKDAHRTRVTQRGLALSAHRKGGALNHAGWQIMQQAEEQPGSYPATGELFTSDRQRIYGVLLHPQGDRYGAEVNGTRHSGWGVGQNRDFQETAPFRALRSEKPLHEAIDEGVHAAAGDPLLRQAIRLAPSAEQMVYWMQELTEITLLDYIFSQQDRIGNIDYLSYWYWNDGDEIRRLPADGTRVPDAIAQYHPVRIRRTQLNDNDAGGRVKYANFAKKTRMLEKIRHYSPDTYRRLISLDQDFASQGALYRYVRTTFGLSDAQFRQVLRNTRMAADILRDSCRAGRLRFDLDPASFLMTGEPVVRTIDCDDP